MRWFVSFCRFPALLGVLLLIGTAAADPVLTQREPVQLTLIEAGPEHVGLQVRLAPGWKFYWRSPGEGGVPPRFDWSASQNLAAAEVAWPAPRRIAIGAADLHGYTGEVILPIALTRKRRGEPVVLNLTLEYGVCKDVCILREDNLSRILQPDAAADASALARLARWQAQVPRPAQAAGITLVSQQAEAGMLTVVLAGERPFDRPDLFVEGTPEAWFGRPEISLTPDRRTARFVIPVQPAAAASGLPLTLTLTDTALAAELTLRP